MTATDTSSLPKRLEWQFARVCDIVAETRRVKSLVLQPVHWTGHLPGQHIDIRLTAEDGYQAQRYREKLDAMARSDGNLHVVYTLTREQPKDWTGHRGRIDRALLVANCFPPAQNPAIYVCGPTAFVEAVSGFLVELGFDPLNIKTERFGPSGG